MSMNKDTIPISPQCMKIHEHGLYFKNYLDEDICFRDTLRKSFYRPNRMECDKNRLEQLMLAVEFENLAREDERITEKNIVVERICGDKSDIKNYDHLFLFKSLIFNNFQSSFVRKFPTIRLKIGNLKSIYGDIETTFENKILFRTRPESQLTNLRIAYDITYLPNDMSLCLGYKALKTIADFDLIDFFRDFEKVPQEASLSPRYASTSPRYASTSPRYASTSPRYASTSPCYASTSPCYNSNSLTTDLKIESTPETDKEKIESFDWINGSIGGNLEQQTAIKNIVNCTAFPFPFVIFGPPGTGKTTVLVEAVKQIIQLKPASRILITAQSNSACNEISLRLINSTPAFHIIRLFSSSQFNQQHNETNIPNEISMISNQLKNINVVSLQQYSVIVTTVVTSSKLKQSINLAFDYIFIDECASATEPEALIPILKFGAKNSKITSNIILLGDHKQLGPILKSQLSVNLGLDVSLMERIMTKKRYQVDSQANSDYVIQLLDNYRSHPAILHLSNIVFYDSKLRTKMTDNDKLWAYDWTYLKNKDFPILFHSTDQQSSINFEGSSYNDSEVLFVLAYITFLLKDGVGSRKITAEDIGILTPYKAQAHLLKESLKNSDIEIGSAEYYQGREKNIIIVSTVRSQSQTIGFLNNKKRLNVLMTRAKHLLIIVGNPWTLEEDRGWKSLLDFCYINNAFCGLNYTPGLPAKSSRTNEYFNEPEVKRQRR